jgi:hypothetical protein
MKKKEKEPPKLQQFCHFHENNLATYICHECGKSICYYCQKNYTMPYLCPECMPGWWDKKVKREKILCATPVIVIIVIMLSLITYAIFFEPDYEEDDYDYSSIYIEDDDIIPILNTDMEPGTNKLDLTLKIYATNEGNKDTGNVFIELHVMQNGTSRTEAQSSTGIIRSEKTQVFFINTTILSGEYDLQLVTWEDGKVVEKGQKSIQLSEGDIQNIKAYEVLEDVSPDAMADEESKEGADDGFGGSGLYFIWPFLIIGIIILPIIAYLFYRERTKPPSQRARPPMPSHLQLAGQHNYQQPPNTPKV